MLKHGCEGEPMTTETVDSDQQQMKQGTPSVSRVFCKNCQFLLRWDPVERCGAERVLTFDPVEGERLMHPVAREKNANFDCSAYLPRGPR